MAGQAREWLQLNVALARHSGSALPSARCMLRELESAFPSDQRGSGQFFFQRKPPDLRLRFFGLREDLVRRLRPVISRAKSHGDITRHFYSVYEPEYRQLGGPVCMRAVHAFWSADSLAWIAIDRLAERGGFTIPHATLMAAVLDDLFWRVLPDGGEVWDTWCNLAVLVRGSAEVDDRSSIRPELEKIKTTASTEEAELIFRYQQASATLADGLSRAWQTGRMQCGVRSILPYVALFTLNRHGFDQAKSAAIARAMAAAWNPKQYLRGAQAERAEVRETEPEELPRAHRSAGRAKSNERRRSR